MQTEIPDLELSPEIAVRNRWRERIPIAALAVSSAVLYFVSLGKAALLDWDEALYAEISKQSLRTHHWLTPYWNGHPFFEKSPLTFWIRTAFFQWFGISEFWARAESALAGIGIVMLTFALVRRWWGMRAGLFAGLVLLTTREFGHATRQAMCDAPLCFFIYLSLYAYVRLIAPKSRMPAGWGPLRDGNNCWWYVICAAIGLGAMVKGPAIVIAPAAILMDRLLRRKEPWLIGWREYVLGAFLFLAIAAPWHLWMWSHYGRAFLDEYAGRQVITRAFQPIDNNRGGVFFYFRAIARDAFPWSMLVPFAALRWIRRPDREHCLPWIVVLITLGLYTFVTTKIVHYVDPLYPALAMELGRFLAELSVRRRALHYVIVAVLAAGMLITFTKYLTFRGLPLTRETAQLAKLAPKSPYRGTLVLVELDSSDAELSFPAAMFYSDRTAIALYLPPDANTLANLVQSAPSIDAILEKEVVPVLSRSYRIQPLAEDGDLLYAMLSRLP